MISGLRYKVLLTILLLLQISSFLPAQEKKIRFQYLTSDNGLTQNLVDCILRDSKGFMWFGTWNGLNRFDGYSFTTFKRDSRDSSSLSGNFIYALAEDKYGNIWVGTENGLNVFLTKYEVFIHQHSGSPASESISSDRIQALLADKNGFLWVGTDRGLDKLTIDADGTINECSHFIESTASNGLSSNSVTSIFQDNAGNIWIGTSLGLNMINSSSESVIKYRSEPEVSGTLSSDVINTVYQDKKGIIWIGTLNGLNRMDPSTRRFFAYFHSSGDPGSLIHNTVRGIIEDPQGNLIIGTLGGLSILKGRSNSFTNLTSTGIPYFSLNNEFVNCLLSSDDGNIWIGTDRGGINRYNVYQNNFEYFENELNNKNSLSHNTVNSVYEDDRFIWIGTAGGGLNRYDKSSGQFSHHRLISESTSLLASDFISAIFRHRNSDLWIGTWGGGLHLVNQYRTEIRTFIHFQNDPSNINSLINDYISCITEDRFGYLWIGTLGGIERYDPRKGKFDHFLSLFEGKTINRVGCLHFDLNDNLWAGTEVGLYKIWSDRSGSIDCRNSVIDYFINQPSDSGSISGNYLFLYQVPYIFT